LSVIETDAATLAHIIREQTALPLADDEAERLARAIETSADDRELLANTVSAIRLLVDRLAPPAGAPSWPPERATPARGPTKEAVRVVRWG
jgi:hypothetical protein